MLFYPTFFSQIAQYVAIVHSEKVIFEVHDNFQKQTYRNRCNIYGANGKQSLNIPVLKANSKQATQDVQIDHREKWQYQHLKSIASAYNSSPFYEYFDHELETLFEKKEKYLLDFNFNCHEFIIEHAQLEATKYQKTMAFQTEFIQGKDYRFLVDAKSNQHYDFHSYRQVFSDKHGFIENLSILDLLFMEGGNTLNYLESQPLHF